nr:hypothetical protein [Tanacetum cinerariifolium]
MSRDVITVGSRMRILLLHRGEYSQWRKRFMNYLEEQTDGEAMINYIQNEKKTRKINRLARSLLIQGLPNDIYSPIDSNETAKDLWDALERQMRGSEYGEQDRKAAILYEYKTFKAIKGEQLLDTYLCYLQVINDLKKCGYKKENCELNYKFLNNLQLEWKQYGTRIRKTKNLMDINIDALYNILKQNQGDVNDALEYKKKVVVITSDPLALVAEKTNKSKRKEKAFNRRKFYSKPTNNNLRTSSTSQSANKKQEFVKTDDKKVEKKDDEKKRDLSKVKCYNCNKKGHFSKNCKKAKDQAWMESSSDSDQEINANMVFMAQFKKVLLESDESSSSAKNTIAETVHMIMPSKDNLYNGRKGIGFENPSNFEKAKDLRPMLYDEKVIGLGYTLMFLTHSDEALEIEKYKRSRENKIEFAYDYRNLNASYVNEKINFLDDYFQEIINLDIKKIDSPFQQTSSLKPYVSNVILEKIIIDLEDEVVSLLEKEKSNLKTIKSFKSKGFESSENAIFESENQSENDCHVVEKECDQVENPKVIAPGMFKLSVSQSVSPISMSKTSCESKNVENTFSSVRRPKNSGVIWKKKWSSNTFNVDLSAVSLLKLNKNVMRYSRKDLLSCLEVTFRKSTCFVRNEDGVDFLTGDSLSNLYTIALNKVASNSLTCLLEKASSLQSWLWHQRLSHLNFATINNLVKNNLVQGLPKMKFKKDHLCSACEQGKIHRKHHKSKTAFASNKPLYLLHMDLCGSMHVESINGKRYVLVVRVRTDNGMEFMNKTLAKFFDEVGITQQFFAARTPQQNGVVERKNRTLVESARTMLTFANLPLFLWAEAIATTYFTQNHSFIHKRFDKTPYELMKKRKLNIKFFRVFRCRCYLLNDFEDVGKLKAKGDIRVFVGYLKESATFRIYNKQTHKIHESVNVNFDEISEMASKQFKRFGRFFQNFYDEYFDSSNIMKSSTTNVETSINEEVFHKVSESFQEESCLLSSIEPANVAEALKDADWISAMQDELDQFARLKVWRLVPQPEDHVYVLDKALFGLKQAPRAWYDVVSQFLIESDFQKVGKPVDHTDYRSMIGSLMYVTSSRPDIMFATCLWNSKDSGFDLTAYSDVDHAGCHIDRKDAKTIWAKIIRLMQGSDISQQERQLKLMNEFVKFVTVEGESLTSVYERNQVVIQDGCVDIQSKMLAMLGMVTGMIPRTDSTLRKTNIQCYNCNGKSHYVRECPKPRVHDAKYFKEQMLLTTKDEAEVHLDEKENDFMLNNAYGDKIEVHDSQIDMINGLLSKCGHEQHRHEKLETIIYTSADDQIDSDIIFDDDPFMDNNSG